MPTPSKDVLIEKIIDIGSKTGQFSASRGNDTDLVIVKYFIKDAKSLSTEDRRIRS